MHTTRTMQVEPQKTEFTYDWFTTDIQPRSNGYWSTTRPATWRHGRPTTWHVRSTTWWHAYGSTWWCPWNGSTRRAPSPFWCTSCPRFESAQRRGKNASICSCSRYDDTNGTLVGVCRQTGCARRTPSECNNMSDCLRRYRYHFVLS